MNVLDLNHIVKTKGEALGFELVSISKLAAGPTVRHYEDWISENKHASMDYLKNHLEAKKNPEQFWSPHQSVISVGKLYINPIDEALPFKQLKIAKYARQSDYHHWLKSKLNDLIEELKDLFPGEQFKAMTDSVPLLERDLAQQAGLGWFGKNTCIINPKLGSFFLLGEILTTLKTDQINAAVPDFCGKCTKCIDACPTGAIEKPHTLNANKCLSFWNIEAKTPPPIEIREKNSGWFFGCDICQDVCPWNHKPLKNISKTTPPEFSEADLAEEIRLILTGSGKALIRNIQGTPLERAGHKGLRRNAMIVAAHFKLKSVSAEISSFKEDPYYEELVAWTLKTINS